MNEDFPRFGDAITPSDSVSLMRLYAELSELALEARKVIRDGSASTTLSRIRVINERLNHRFDHVRAVAR
jgi:hypothetical protein